MVVFRPLSPHEQNLAGSLLPVETGREVLVLQVSGSVAIREPIKSDCHLLLVVEEGAEATVCLEVSAAQFDCEVIVRDGARLSIVTIQEGEHCTIRQRSSIGAGAELHWHNVSLGAELSQTLLSEVTGDHATSSIDWISYVRGTEKQQLSAHNLFSVPNGRGEIHMRSVAEERGQAAQRGMIEIGLKGTGTDTYLTQEVLMLDRTAKVDAIPALEIRTNDVKASHSASVSRLTEEDLFYFSARGIPEEEARTMYIEGFLAGATDSIESPEIRELVRGRIEHKYRAGR